MTEINCFDILPGNYSEQELNDAIPHLKLYVENLYIGPGKIEDVSKIPIAAFFSNRIDQKQICVITKLAKKYKEHVHRINKKIQEHPIGNYGITLPNKKVIKLGKPSKFSPIEISKLSEVIDQFGGDTEIKKKEPRFKTLTTKGSFFDEKYPYDDLLFDYDGTGVPRRAKLYYTGKDKVRRGYDLNETEHEIASLFAKQCHMKLNGDKGYFSDKGTGKSKKTDAQKDNFIKTFWKDFTEGIYYKRVVKQPCVSCDGQSKYCWAKNIQEFENINRSDVTAHRYMRKSLSTIFKGYNNYKNTDFGEFIRQVDFIAQQKADEREFRKGTTDDKIELRKNEIIQREEKKHNRSYALVDDRKEPLGKVTPMLLRLFTGAKSKLYSPGEITTKIEPEDCILNICGGNIPKPPQGRCWGAVICDPTVRIVVWFKPIIERKGVLSVVGDGDITFGDLSLISSKDKMFKFEKARKLNENIKIVKQSYESLLDSNNKEKQQIGVIVYLLDHYGFRGGSEEDKDSTKEEDGIGVTTLPINSIKSLTNSSIHLSFKGKSGIQFDEQVKIPSNISNLIKSFIEGRPKNSRVFNLVDLEKVNQYLHSIDSLFSAKVFRTRLASEIMSKCLNSKSLEIKQGDIKKISKEKFDSCNMTVAIALNHKKKATPTEEAKLKKMKEDIDILKKSPKDKQKIKELENKYKLDKQLWEVNLGTSIKNYIDPRIIVAWAKKQSEDWNEDFKRKTTTVNNLDDLYLLPQMKFVKAKTEEEDGGAISNPEFVWAIESVNHDWNWQTSPLLISDSLQPKDDADKQQPDKLPKPKPQPKPQPKPRPKPKPKPQPRHDSSSDSEDDIPIGDLIKKRKDVEVNIPDYLKQIPGDDKDFDLLLKICLNQSIDDEQKLKNINPSVLKWIYPFSLYSITNDPESPDINYSIVSLCDEMNS